MSKPRSKPTLTIVILSFNVERLLIDCLKSVFATQTTANSWKVVVADNVSSDNSVASVKKLFPQVEIIQNSQNLGFSKGNNVALRRVNTEYTLLLNPDTVVYPHTIQKVLTFMIDHPKVGAATCRVELPDGSLDYSCHRGFPDPWNTFLYFFAGKLKKFSGYSDKPIPDIPHEIDALTGAFAMIRTKVGKKLNWLDEDYTWNGEDLDFCYRLKQLGWKVMYIPDVKITHFKGSSSGLWKTGQYQVAKAKKLTAARQGVDAMRIFYNKHLKVKYPWIFNQFIYLGMFLLKTIRQAKIHLGQGI